MPKILVITHYDYEIETNWCEDMYEKYENYASPTVIDFSVYPNDDLQSPAFLAAEILDQHYVTEPDICPIKINTPWRWARTADEEYEGSGTLVALEGDWTRGEIYNIARMASLYGVVY